MDLAWNEIKIQIDSFSQPLDVVAIARFHPTDSRREQQDEQTTPNRWRSMHSSRELDPDAAPAAAPTERFLWKTMPSISLPREREPGAAIDVGRKANEV